jgi:hypothetical protein
LENWGKTKNNNNTIISFSGRKDEQGSQQGGELFSEDKHILLLMAGLLAQASNFEFNIEMSSLNPQIFQHSLSLYVTMKLSNQKPKLMPKSEPQRETICIFFITFAQSMLRRSCTPWLSIRNLSTGPGVRISVVDTSARSHINKTSE